VILPTTHVVFINQPRVADLPLHAASVSSDGNTVVGYVEDRSRGSRDVRWAPCKWSQKKGLERLGLGEALKGLATQCSADGSVVIGSVWRDSTVWTAVWRNGTEPKLISKDYSLSDSDAGGPSLSGDGVWVVGMSRHRPFKWSASTGLEFLKRPSGESADGAATGINYNGTVIVGYVIGAEVPLALRQISYRTVLPKHSFIPCLWQAGRGSKLVKYGNEKWVDPLAVTGDGNSFIANVKSAKGDWPVQWTAKDGFQRFDGIHQKPAHSIRRIAEDGGIFYGLCIDEKYPKRQFLRTVWSDNGPTDLKDFLRSIGAISLLKHDSLDIQGMSYKSKVIVGTYQDRQSVSHSWIVDTR